MLFLQVLHSHVPEQATGALELQPIGKHTNLNVATPDVGAVITVDNGIDKCPTQSFERIFGEFRAKTPSMRTVLRMAPRT